MLADERFDDGECLTRAWCADHPSAAEGVYYIHPALAELALIVVAHGDVDAILVLDFVGHLLEALVLEVEAVFQQTILQILGDIVKSHMAKHGAYDGHHKIQPGTAV